MRTNGDHEGMRVVLDMIGVINLTIRKECAIKGFAWTGVVGVCGCTKDGSAVGER